MAEGGKTVRDESKVFWSIGVSAIHATYVKGNSRPCKRMNAGVRSFVLQCHSPTCRLYFITAMLTRRGGVYDMRQRFLLYLLEPSEMSSRVTNGGGGVGHTDGHGSSDLIS